MEAHKQDDGHGLALTPALYSKLTTPDGLRYTLPKTETNTECRDVRVLGLSLKRFSPELQLGIVSLATIAFHMLYAIVQERTLSEEKYPYSWYMVWVQSAFLSLFAFLENKQWRDPLARKGTLMPYILLAFVFIIGRASGNIALKYIDYTTRVLFQSSRPVPVMLIGIVWLHKRYNMQQYAATVLLIVGLVLFSKADAATSASFSMFGVLCSIVNSCSLAFKSNMQEHILGPGIHTLEVAFWGNFVAVVVLVPYLLFSGELVGALAYTDARTHLMIMIQFFFNYLGSVTTLEVIALSGSFTGSVVSSTRQVLSVLLSFFLFAKPFTTRHMLATAVFFGGLLLYIWSTKAKAVKPEKKDH
eukprot:TRINITY_DN1277_c0_g1_i3.p1 TRINITY_DN1277_c0_g1~~TRINITY_DN1277_c0_g1_i3.p1  ORF type:complete len:359 (+),score=30.30 TRINITY_DN1277_c0_g1_i3:1454-2530(+)